jgi:tetratricopeptide (TPR) repeat protein
MSQEQVEQFIRESQQSMQTGHFGSALELCEQAIALNPNSSEAHVLRGVALAQLNRPEEATHSFQAGIRFGPNNPKAFFNLAVHHHQQGQKALSEEMAKETLRIAPDHSGAKSLLAGSEVSKGSKSHSSFDKPTIISGMELETPATNATQPTATYRPGYDATSEGSLQFVERMGNGWDATGILLSIASLLLGCYGWAISIIALAEMGSSFANSNAMSSMFEGLGGWVSVVSAVFGLFGIAWMILDLIHRRGNWLWMLPYTLCCCCSIGGITQLIYMWKGRE